jgi:RNA polymerase sigma-70 factor (ECF subfamily)
LRRFLSTRSRDEAEIDDVLQETFLRAARYRQTLKDPKRLRSWAFRIAANVLADRIRREARYSRATDGEPLLAELATEESEAPEPSILIDGESEPRDDVLNVLVEALDKLRSRDRSLIEAFYGGAGSCRETAEFCSVPEDVVKVRLYRARTQLRDYVTQEVDRKRRKRARTGGAS